MKTKLIESSLLNYTTQCTTTRAKLTFFLKNLFQQENLHEHLYMNNLEHPY
jgi:hypothetical protein